LDDSRNAFCTQGEGKNMHPSMPRKKEEKEASPVPADGSEASTSHGKEASIPKGSIQGVEKESIVRLMPSQ